MFRKIIVPVDLSHLDKLSKSLEVAASIAKLFGAHVCYVGVTATVPTDVAHDPKEFARKLEDFGKQQAGLHGSDVSVEALTVNDPATELDDVLLKAIQGLGADLVIMASHVPTIADYVWPSNGGKVAAHAGVSVFLVR